MLPTSAEPATAEREIVVRRVFDAPREIVYQAWTEPEHVARWWGPNGFTTTTHEMDVRPGGVCRFVMHDPDGTDYPNRIVFSEVTPPERLVYTHSDDGVEDAISFQVTVTFEDRGAQTVLTMHSLFATTAERDTVVREYGAIEGARQTLGRLAEYLTTF